MSWGSASGRQVMHIFIFIFISIFIFIFVFVFSRLRCIGRSSR